jgi:hypothetical protein
VVKCHLAISHMSVVGSNPSGVYDILQYAAAYFCFFLLIGAHTKHIPGRSTEKPAHVESRGMQEKSPLHRVEFSS